MGPSEAESFLLTAIQQLKDLNKIIDVTSNDLLENIKRSDKKDADKIIRKIFNRLEVTCNLGSDKIQEILRNLRTDFKNYTQNKTEKEKANKTIVPVPMVTLPNVNNDSQDIVETVENDSTNVNDDIQDIVEIVVKDSTTSNKAESNEVVNENNSDGNNTILDDNSNEAKTNAEDDKVKLKLVAIEKLMDPKLLNNGPNQSIRSKNNSNNKTTRLKSISSDDDFVPISGRRPVRNVKKLMDLSVICLDDTTDESSSNSDSVIVISSRKSRSESNKSKSVKKDTNNDKENLKELLAKCKPVKVKINKLPKNLEKLMKLHGVTEIKNNRNKVIAKLTSKSEEHKNLDKTAKKRGRSTSVNSLLSEISSTTSTKRSKRKENILKEKETTKERSSSSLKSNKNATGRNKTDSDKSKNNDSGNESKSETGKNKKNKDNGKIGNGTDNNSERESHDETMNNDTSEKSVNAREKKEKQLNGKSKNTLEKSSEKFQHDKVNKSKLNVDDDVDSEIVENGIDKEPNNSNDSVEPELSDTEKSGTKKNNKKKKSSSKACQEEESDNEKNEDKENSNSSSSENDPILKKMVLRKVKTKSSTSNEDDFRENTRRSHRNSTKLKSAQKCDKNSEDDDNDEDDDEEPSSKKSSLKNERASSDSDCFQQQTKKRKIIKDGDSSDNNSDSDEDTDEKPKKRKRIKQVNNSDSSDDDDDDNGNKGRKNIRNILKEKDLKDETKQATKNEMERKKRIEDRQKMYNIIYEDQLTKVKAIDKLVLDFDEKTKEEFLSVDSKLIKQLKPHQGAGVKFMWDACFETIEHSADGSGSGCILAHCMGLGKSLQIVTLVHTLLTHSNRTNVERVLIIAPLSTVLNWVNEFRKWLAFCSKNKDIEIYELSKYKKNVERAFKLQEWYQDGGVLILGYDMFRNLVSETSGKIRKKVREQIQTSLIDPGPDMVVCDEGHLLKNEKTSVSKSVNRIKTLRRIVLTGTPLQNNLKEYYCMVQFVKPNLLGKFTEYMNRFVNPITNGQYTDSTQADIQLMKKRSHVLHKMLDGCVQRQDYSVLAPFLPPKYEYVVFVQLTELQVQLYKYYMENKSGRIDSTQKRSSILFADFQNLQRIWTHPRVLRYNSDKYEQIQQKKRDQESEDDFIADNSSEESSSSSSSSESSGSEVNSTSGKKHTTVSRKTRANADQFDSEPELLEAKIENPTEWWTSMVTDNDLDSLRNSGKLMLLFSILKECESVGDKLLIFSQSLYSLDIIEHFLKIIHEKRNSKNVDENDNTCGYQSSWKPGQDYFRLDGSTSIEYRNASCKIFNNCNNTTARLFLISTRAGGLGINLVSANRVIIFDVSWNPSHDIQSIFRVYRFGQLKPCYIYRFIALGSMEEKIYERQVTKLAISKRVIDEQQIDRHYKETDLMELYRYEIEPEEPRPIPLVPKDRLFADLLKNNEKFIYKYHEHDSLLENKEEETLNEDERKVAWEEFEAEKNRPQLTYIPPRVTGPVTSNFIFGFRTDILLRLLSIKARRDNPLFNDHEVRQMVPLLLQTLHSQMEVGDGSMYKELINLQSEMEIPAMAYSPLMSQLGMSTGISNAFLNQNMGLGGINHVVNPYAVNASSASQLRAQHQQLEQYAIEQQQKMMQEQAKARLLELERNLAAGLHTEVIDLD